MKRKLVFILTLCLLTQLVFGTSLAANARVGEEEVHKQALELDRAGTLVALTGLETMGKSIVVGGKSLTLPNDVYIKRHMVTWSCEDTIDCIDEPVFILARGKSEGWVGKRSGKLLRSHGDTTAFDFVNHQTINSGAVVPTEYFGERQDLQDTAPGVENYVNWDIVQGRAITYWVVPDPAWPNVPSYVSTAVSRWNSALGRTYFVQATSESTANLTIQAITGGAGLGFWGPDVYWNSPERNANYVAKATVLLNMSALTPTGGWETTVEHELGHALGLGEQYTGATSVCTPTPSIMWTASCQGRPTTPTSADISRVNSLYNTGALTNFTGNASGGTYTVSWTDGAWGENYVNLAFERSYSSGWSAVANVAHLANTGLKATAPWNTLTITRSFSLSTYGLTAGTYRVCGNTVHYWSGSYSYGPRVCGPAYNLQ